MNSSAVQVAHLREMTNAMARQNLILQQMNERRHVKKLKRRKLRSKSDASITNRRGHRPTIPAKLRFRRQRTTHRSVYCQGKRRGW